MWTGFGWTEDEFDVSIGSHWQERKRSADCFDRRWIELVLRSFGTLIENLKKKEKLFSVSFKKEPTELFVEAEDEEEEAADAVEEGDEHSQDDAGDRHVQQRRPAGLIFVSFFNLNQLQIMFFFSKESEDVPYSHFIHLTKSSIDHYAWVITPSRGHYRAEGKIQGQGKTRGSSKNENGRFSKALGVEWNDVVFINFLSFNKKFYRSSRMGHYPIKAKGKIQGQGETRGSSKKKWTDPFRKLWDRNQKMFS